MLDRALAKTFANLTTLLLIACVVTIPLFLAHAIVFRDVVALRELAPEIRSLPEGRQVRGVAAPDMEAEQRWRFVATGVALLALPFVYRAARRVYEVDDSGGVATVPDALSHLRSSGPRSGVPAAPVTAAIGIGALIAWPTWQITDAVAHIGPDPVAWVVVGVGHAAAAAMFVAVVAGTAAAVITPDRGPRAEPVEKLDLY